MAHPSQSLRPLSQDTRLTAPPTKPNSDLRTVGLLSSYIGQLLACLRTKLSKNECHGPTKATIRTAQPTLFNLGCSANQERTIIKFLIERNNPIRRTLTARANEVYCLPPRLAIELLFFFTKSFESQRFVQATASA